MFCRPPLLLALLSLLLAACGGEPAEPASDAAPAAPSIEMPVTEIELGPLNADLAATGQVAYETRCQTCHKLDERYIGPALGDVVARRDPVYIMNMILAPEKMLQADADAQALLAEYSVPMTNQNLTQDEARAILEYLRQVGEGT